MARVCVDWFPNKKNPKKAGFYMDDNLKLQLDVLLKNIKNDWDFTIIICGEGEVRVGKSKLAMDIACYWSYQIWKLYKIKVPFNLQDNFVFEGTHLIKKGNMLGQSHPYSALVFDEAGADLEGRKVMQGSTQDVLDFFRECGQYNLLNILVLPEYFDLPKGIALSRSMFLINVYYTADDDGLFVRGYFNFFSKRQKKWLYLKGKKDLNYKSVAYDFHGRFYNFYQVNEKEYRKAKQEALSRRESKKRNKFQMQRDACFYLLCSEGMEGEDGEVVKLTQENLSKRLEQLTGIFIARNTISDGLRHFQLEDERNKSEKKGAS
jgi:hypothetical protein